MKKLSVLFVFLFMILVLSGCRAGAAVSGESVYSEPITAQLPNGDTDKSLVGTWGDIRGGEGDTLAATIYAFKANRTFEQTKVLRASSGSLGLNLLVKFAGGYQVSDDVLTMNYTRRYTSTDGGKNFKTEFLLSTSEWRYTFGVDGYGEYVEWTNTGSKDSDDNSETSASVHKYYKQSTDVVVGPQTSDIDRRILSKGKSGTGIVAMLLGAVAVAARYWRRAR